MLTIVVTALNEEKNIEKVVATIQEAAQRAGLSAPGTHGVYEIVIGNDGSTDQTQVIVDQMVQGNPFVRAIHFSVNQGPGAVFFEALKNAQGDQITCLPGDNSLSLESMVALFSLHGKSEFILSYIENTEDRPRFRRMLSSVYTRLWKLMFRLPVRYINGTCLYPTEKARALGFRSRRFAFSAELTTRLLLAQTPFLQIPMRIQSSSGKSSALRWPVLGDVLKSFLGLVMDTRFMTRSKKSWSSQLKIKQL